MANEETLNPKIYILSRNNYNAIGEDAPPIPNLEYGNNVFFVRENSTDTADMLSLYVGTAHQTDVYPIEHNDMFLVLDSEGHTICEFITSALPKYKTPGKLFYYEQIEEIDPEHPDPDDPEHLKPLANHKILMYMWVSTEEGTAGGYMVKVGGDGDGDSISADGVTILNNGGVISGAGADISGLEFVIDSVTKTAGDNVIVLNNYPTSDNQTKNIALGDNSVTFGANNISNVKNSIVGGNSNEIQKVTTSTTNASNCVNVLGSQNKISGNVSGSGALKSNSNIYINGSSNLLGPNSDTWLGTENVYIMGHNCSLQDTLGSNYELYLLGNNIESSQASTNVIAIGSNLAIDHFNAAATRNCSIIGYWNSKLSASGSFDFVIGNGTDNSHRSNSLVINTERPQSGEQATSLVLDPSKTSGRSNIFTNNGVAVQVCTDEDIPTISADNAQVSLNYLPENSSIMKLTTTNHTVQSVTISLTNVSDTALSYKVSKHANTIGGNTVLVGSDYGMDYTSVITFRKSSSVSDALDLMGNFTANNASKIHLINPNIDISSADIVSIFLFYDGVNMCAIVYGYEE